MPDTISDTREDDLLVVHYAYFETAGTTFSEESRLSDEGARSARGPVRYLETDIRQLDRMLDGLERRFPEAVSR